MWILQLGNSLTNDYLDLLESQLYFLEVILGYELTSAQRDGMRGMPTIDTRFDSEDEIIKKALMLKDLYERQ